MKMENQGPLDSETPDGLYSDSGYSDSEDDYFADSEIPMQDNADKLYQQQCQIVDQILHYDPADVLVPETQTVIPETQFPKTPSPSKGKLHTPNAPYKKRHVRLAGTPTQQRTARQRSVLLGNRIEQQAIIRKVTSLQRDLVDYFGQSECITVQALELNSRLIQENRELKAQNRALNTENNRIWSELNQLQREVRSHRAKGNQVSSIKTVKARRYAVKSQPGRSQDY